MGGSRLMQGPINPLERVVEGAGRLLLRWDGVQWRR